MNIGGHTTTILHKTRQLALFVGCLLLVTASASPLAVSAQSSGAIAQTFPADTGMGDIVAGSLVSFKSDSRQVELATVDSADNLVGVADKQPLLVISGDTTEAQIVLGGTTNVLVSDINGSIRAGDKITASPIAGVGMLATGETRIVGTAQSDFDTGKAETKEITDTNGKPHQVQIGYLPLQVGLAYYQAPGSNFLPPFFQNFANSVAGKQVSLVRLAFCAILLLFSFVSLAILISSTVRSSMISLGRNPLAAPSIRKSLFQVGGVAVAILAGTLVACYLILVL